MSYGALKYKIQHGVEDPPWRFCRDTIAPSTFSQTYEALEEALEVLLIDGMGDQLTGDVYRTVHGPVS